MRMFAAWASLAVLFLTGCSTSPVPSERALSAPASRVTGFQDTVPGGGQIVVVRDTGFIGGGCFAAIYLNGQRVALLDTGEKASFRVPAGEWIVGAGLEGKALCGLSPERLEATAIVKPGESKKFRVYNPGDELLHVSPTTL